MVKSNECSAMAKPDLNPIQNKLPLLKAKCLLEQAETEESCIKVKTKEEAQHLKIQFNLQCF